MPWRPREGSRPNQAIPIEEEAVKFGTFYEHQLPRPWEEGDEQRLVQESLEQVELADRLGIE